MDCRENCGRSRGRKLRHLPQLEMRYVRSPPPPYRTARLYTLRARRSKNRWGKFFVTFSCVVSDAATKAIREEIRDWARGSSDNG